MVDTRCYLSYFQAIFCEEIYLFWLEYRLCIAMAKSTDFLGVEPIKVAFLASISPSVHTAIISEGHIVVLFSVLCKIIYYLLLCLRYYLYALNMRRRQAGHVAP